MIIRYIDLDNNANPVLLNFDRVEMTRVASVTRARLPYDYRIEAVTVNDVVTIYYGTRNGCIEQLGQILNAHIAGRLLYDLQEAQEKELKGETE